MRILLDTHIFLWFISQSNQLPTNWIDSIRNLDNQVYLSVISIWEAIIKYQTGKLPLPEPPHLYLPRLRDHHLIDSLPVDEPSVLQLAELPVLHRDPFDRLLICQALQHNLTIATVDAAFSAYPMAQILQR
jgi:PIN domain nuclease of toxin-antitoxin system